MGARGFVKAVAVLALLATGAQAGASTVVEPIARLVLEGGYDTNPFHDGSGTAVQRECARRYSAHPTHAPSTPIY